MSRRVIIGWTTTTLGLTLGVGILLLSLMVHPSRCEPGMHAQEAGSRGEHRSTVRVKVIRPSREHGRRMTTQPAHVEPYEETDIYAKVAGYLEKVHVDIGSRVEKDQVLAQLWIPEIKKELELKKAMVKQAEADVKKAEAAHRLSQSEFARYQQLYQDKSIEQAQLDEKRHRRDADEAGVASARARVEVAERDREHIGELLGYGTIKAPYAGLISRRRVHTGAFIQSAASAKTEPLFTIVRIDRLRIVTEVPESDAALVKIGQAATLRVGAVPQHAFSGQVARFSDALHPVSRTMRVEVDLTPHSPSPNSGRSEQAKPQLRPGMFGSLTIILADHPHAVFLPTSAVMTGGGEPFVFVVHEGRAQRRQVAIGVNDGVRTQITNGLTGDEQIITEGKQQVLDGQTVQIVP